MKNLSSSSQRWANCHIGITGANGSLGRALAEALEERGAVITGICRSIPKIDDSRNSLRKWVAWKCGEEIALKEVLDHLDILIINHGINHHDSQTSKSLNESLEVNALSAWRIMEMFEEISLKGAENSRPKEIWINTSEAEIQPALSPTYEISKRLIGQIISLRWSNLTKENKKKYKIRKLILGPFKSKLNPIGLMSPKFVAEQILRLASIDLNLIIVTPNPITYLLMPIIELSRFIYSKALRKEPEDGG